jgi:hypothetical protein
MTEDIQVTQEMPRVSFGTFFFFFASDIKTWLLLIKNHSTDSPGVLRARRGLWFFIEEHGSCVSCSL